METETEIIAFDPAGITAGQDRLISWADRKLDEEKAGAADLAENLALAKRNKWNTKTIERALGRATKRVNYYEKIHHALKAGYTIVPNFPMDVFAIRTTRKNPSHNSTGQQWGNPADQETTAPPLGEGKTVDSQGAIATVTDMVLPYPNAKEKQLQVINRYADDFKEIDFPFDLAKPRILDACGQAIAEKCFDELGVLPARPNRGPAAVSQNADPMIIGRIRLRDSQPKSLSFLIAWFIDTKDL